MQSLTENDGKYPRLYDVMLIFNKLWTLLICISLLKNLKEAVLSIIVKSVIILVKFGTTTVN